MSRVHPGFTLLELMLVLAITALAWAIGLRQVHRYLDRMATRAAVLQASLAVAEARDAALAQHAMTTLGIDTVAGTVAVLAGGERLRLYALGLQHGVTLSTSRDSVTFDVRGLGYGAANLTLVARRGTAVDTLVLSRLGRARY